MRNLIGLARDPVIGVLLVIVHCPDCRNPRSRNRVDGPR
jgi:hypothetical protein